MSRTSVWLCVCVMLIGCAVPMSAQQPTSTTSTTSNTVVPSLVSFTGTLTDVNGKPLTGVVGVTFALYKESQGGAPLWLETQNVYPDKTGHYKVQLGAATSAGLPADLFVAGEARWLGVQAQGQAEQPRVSLLSVPYALKAADAQTVGGLPASAFVLAAPPSSAATSIATPNATAQPLAPGTTPVTTAGGTINKLAKFDATADITSSQIFDNGTNVGIGNTTPGAKLDVSGGTTIRGLLTMPTKGTATATVGFTSQPIKLTASAFNSGTGTAAAQNFQLQAEPAGNNTATTSGTLNLLYATGSNALAETGLKIASNGRITFATGQTFPGTGTGTVKSVGLAAPLSDFIVSGSPVTGTGTLNIAWNVAPTSANTANAIVKRDGSGNFSAGTITAGAVNAAALLGNGAGVTNVNAAALGGLAPGAFAQLAAANSFTASQTISGNLGVTGNFQLSGSGNGVIFPDGTNQRTAALFKSIVSSGFTFPGAGVTNMLQLNITVPTSGYLFASASGYCNVSTGTSSVQWAYIIGLSASEGWSFPKPLVYLPSGSNVGQFPITAERVFPVSAGLNSIFLNVDNIQGTPLSSCGAQLTAIFTPAQLP